MGGADDAPDQPFAGIRIVEFGQFVAVPFAGQLLAEGGADVIKVEAPEGDPTRKLNQIAPNESRTFISRNRGKRSLPLKVSDPAAKHVIEALLVWADVVLMNFRPGLADRIGLGSEALLERYPQLIVGNVTPFGKEGPDAGLAGMDIVVQARSGLMAANGRYVDGRPAPGDPVSADYMCAMTLSFAVASALLRRERTGRGGTVDVSLMQAAMTLANNQLTRSEVRDRDKHAAVKEQLAELRRAGVPFSEQAEKIPSARAMPLLMVYFRTYDTADGTIAVACGSHKLRVGFLEVTGLADGSLSSSSQEGLDGHYDGLKQEAESLFATRTSDDWIAALSEGGIPVSSVRFPLELFDDPQAIANDMFHLLPHATAGDMRVLAPPVKMDADGFQPGRPMASFGSDTTEILAEIGVGDDDLAALAAAGVTHTGDG